MNVLRLRSLSKIQLCPIIYNFNLLKKTLPLTTATLNTVSHTYILNTM